MSRSHKSLSLLFALAACLASLLASTGNAQAAATYYSGTGHWYQVFSRDASMSWHMCRDEAVAKGGYLATITSIEENNFILTLGAPTYHSWIGGTDEGHEGVWRWVTGETFWSNGTALMFAKWDSGEPNNSGGIEHFLDIITAGPDVGEWNDGTASAGAGTSGGGVASYIVEYNTDPNSPPVGGNGKFGNAHCFNGIDDYILVPDNSSLNPSTALTIEAWINLDDLPTLPVLEYAIVSKWAGTGSAGGRYMLGVAGSGHPGQLILNLPYDGAFSSQALTPGLWYHVAATYDGSNIRFYINGQLDNTVPAAGGLGWSSTPLAIGKNIHNNLDASVGPYYFKGRIDEVRVSNVARGAGQFCLSSPCVAGSGTVALWHLDETAGSTIADASGNNNNGSVNGNGCATQPPQPDHDNPAFIGAHCFNGPSDYITVPNAALNNMTAGTVEAWVKFDNLSGPGQSYGEQIILSRSKLASSYVGDLRLAKERSTNGTNLNRFYFTLNNGVTRLYSNTVASVGTWYHVAGTWDGTSWRIFVNGVEERALATTTTLPNDPAMIVSIGRILGVNTDIEDHVYGMIDEVRVSNVARPSGQFCLSSPCASGSGAVALWHLDETSGNSIADASGNGHNGTSTGGGCASAPYASMEIIGQGQVIWGVVIKYVTPPSLVLKRVDFRVDELELSSECQYFDSVIVAPVFVTPTSGKTITVEASLTFGPRVSSVAGAAAVSVTSEDEVSIPLQQQVWQIADPTIGVLVQVTDALPLDLIQMFIDDAAAEQHLEDIGFAMTLLEATRFAFNGDYGMAMQVVANYLVEMDPIVGATDWVVKYMDLDDYYLVPAKKYTTSEQLAVLQEANFLIAPMEALALEVNNFSQFALQVQLHPTHTMAYAAAPEAWPLPFRNDDPLSQSALKLGQVTSDFTPWFKSDPDLWHASTRCPVSIALITPSGDTISGQTDQVSNGAFLRSADPADGWKEEIYLLKPAPGEYQIVITPLQEATAESTYTLLVASGLDSSYCAFARTITPPFPHVFYYPTIVPAPPQTMRIEAFCPIDLDILTPSGRTITKWGETVPGILYTEWDYDSDGDLDDRVDIARPEQGMYRILPLPTPNAEPDELYTLIVDCQGERVILAEDEKVRNIPGEGYSIFPEKYGKLEITARKDNGEGLVAVLINVRDISGTVDYSLITDQAGSAVLDSLPNGAYVVSVVAPLGYSADEDARLVEIFHTAKLVEFSLLEQTSLSESRARGWWAHQLSRAMQGKSPSSDGRDGSEAGIWPGPSESVTKAEFSRFASLISQHFNGNRLNSIDEYSVPQPATQNDSLNALFDLLTFRPRSQGEHVLRRMARAELVAMMLNVVSGKIAQFEPITTDGKTVSQAITYCDRLINDPSCPVGDVPSTYLPGYSRCCELKPWIKACFIGAFVNIGLTLPEGAIPSDIFDIAYKEIQSEGTVPTGFALGQNYPNPFNSGTVISYSLSEESHVRLEVFDVLGRRVSTLVDQIRPIGQHQVVWDGHLESGEPAASGIYFYRIRAGSLTESKKMILVK